MTGHESLVIGIEHHFLIRRHHSVDTRVMLLSWNLQDELALETDAPEFCRLSCVGFETRSMRVFRQLEGGLEATRLLQEEKAKVRVIIQAQGAQLGFSGVAQELFKVESVDAESELPVLTDDPLYADIVREHSGMTSGIGSIAVQLWRGDYFTATLKRQHGRSDYRTVTTHELEAVLALQKRVKNASQEQNGGGLGYYKWTAGLLANHPDSLHVVEKTQGMRNRLRLVFQRPDFALLDRLFELKNRANLADKGVIETLIKAPLDKLKSC